MQQSATHDGTTWAGRALPTAALAGVRVYLAGPRAALDPAGYGALEAALLELGIIDLDVDTAFPAAARALRAAGAIVTCPHEQPWWRGAETATADLRAARARDARALADAGMVVVLDGWADVPGAVDAAVLAAATSGRPWGLLQDVLAGAARGIRTCEAPLRRQAS